MRIWEEHRSLLTGLGIAALAMLAAYFAFISWFSRGTTKIQAAYTDLGGKLDAGRQGPFDLAGAGAALSESNSDLERKIEEITKRVEIEFHPWTEIPREYSENAGVYFFQKHAEQCEELGIECTKANPPVMLSDSALGFPGEVRKGDVVNKEAGENLRRLSIVRRLVLLLLKAGVAEIVKITPSPPVWTGPEGYPKFIREYAVSIHVRTRIDPLMRFLHAVRNPKEFFVVVREFDVRAFDPYQHKGDALLAADEGLLSVVISAAGMRFASEEERPEMLQGASRRPDRPARGGPVIQRKRAEKPLGH